MEISKPLELTEPQTLILQMEKPKTNQVRGWRGVWDKTGTKAQSRGMQPELSMHASPKQLGREQGVLPRALWGTGAPSWQSVTPSCSKVEGIYHPWALPVILQLGPTCSLYFWASSCPPENLLLHVGDCLHLTVLRGLLSTDVTLISIKISYEQLWQMRRLRLRLGTLELRTIFAISGSQPTNRGDLNSVHAVKQKKTKLPLLTNNYYSKKCFLERHTP